MKTTRFHGNSLAGRRILVTGGSGFLGGSLVERLLQINVIVAAVARTPGRLPLLRHAGYCFVPCDLSDSTETMNAFAQFQPEVVFHFASHPDAAEDFSQAQRTMQGNLRITLNTLEALRCSGGKLLIYGDSCKVYGHAPVPYRESTPVAPLSSYAIAKAAGWELCKLYQRIHGLCSVSVRPTMIYGPHQAFNLFSYVADCINNNREARLDGGSQTRDPLFLTDALDAFIAVAERGIELAGRIVNIGGGEEETVIELARNCVRLAGNSVHVVPLANRMRPTDTARSYCDNVEAMAMLGWRPQTPRIEGLKRTLAQMVHPRLWQPRAGDFLPADRVEI